MIMEADFAGLGKRVEEQRQGSERKRSEGHMGEEKMAREKHALSSSALATAVLSRVNSTMKIKLSLPLSLLSCCVFLVQVPLHHSARHTLPSLSDPRGEERVSLTFIHSPKLVLGHVAQYQTASSLLEAKLWKENIGR